MVVKIRLPPGPPPFEPTGRVRVHFPISANPKFGGGPEGKTPSSEQVNFLDESALRETGEVIQALNEACRTLQNASGLETRSREKQSEGVARCYAAARVLLDDDKAWSRFCNEYERKLGTPLKDKQRKDSLRLALLYALGDETVQARKDASLFHRAIRPMFDATKPARLLPTIVKMKGGFKKMAAANAKSRLSQTGSTDKLPSAPNDDAEVPHADKTVAPTTLMIEAKLLDRQLFGFQVGTKLRFDAVVENTSETGFAVTITAVNKVFEA